MELYNFFSELLFGEDGKNRLSEVLSDLNEIEAKSMLVHHTYDEGNVAYSIVGQMYGEDTNIGDTDLLLCFGDIKYTWFDATFPAINNIGK